MASHPSFLIGRTPVKPEIRRVKGGYVDMDGEPFYRISHVNAMPPFFMSIVSDSDLWMFISSNGGITAGRRNPDNALFPYYTDDRIHDGRVQTGGSTALFFAKSGKTFFWEPFADGPVPYRIERNLYKNAVGNRVLFEEINLDLFLCFRTEWTSGDRFGFIRRSGIANNGRTEISVDILDGIQNLLPYGINRRFQLEYSTLADGYKRNELLPDTGLGLFTLSSIPTDKAEPSEALKATTVWSCGLKNPLRLVSSRQAGRFRSGLGVRQESDERGLRGAYFVNARFSLAAGSLKEWFMAADVSQDASRVTGLVRLLKSGDDLQKELLDDVRSSTENLRRIAARADGIQKTGDALSANRHFSNVLFNVMRGGVFDDHYFVDSGDFRSFILRSNRDVAQRQSYFLSALPQRILRPVLLERIAALGDADFEKLGREYLPLTFSRRHGDPSRPWNLFSIELKDAHGGKILNYQGNWRDIFQNWEALALGYPGYAEGMIAKFLNASSADGYNPYRVTREGYEWEKLDPHDPWSYIGYWGDHQIVYLLKLLEVSERYNPRALREWMTRDLFTYADIPYRIKPYPDLLADPRNTIEFDVVRESAVERRVAETGPDGKSLQDRNGRTLHVNLCEKLLVPVLAKLSNFIPEAGIWMNTQRPEWNDANNALVGTGVSMVTLYYLRRHLALCRDLFQTLSGGDAAVSEEVADFLSGVMGTLHTHLLLLEGPLSDADRRKVLDGLGGAGSAYRTVLYATGFSGQRRNLPGSALVEFTELALRYVDHSIRANRRPDGLYHAYNLMQAREDGSISIRRLYEMLEGQAAVLSSGFLSPRESADLLDALAESSLFRKDQSSYILYPDRRLPGFMEKNHIPEKEFLGSELLKRLVRQGDSRIVRRDADGGLHFNGEFRNASMLKAALEAVREDGLRELAERETPLVLGIFERMFDHESFTGRSGTFYKYEGLGCIYWHMVSKLCLAVQETVLRAHASGEPEAVREKLARHYEAIREGIGVHKPPDVYGAFPTDPYSHTPGFAGVQQPGLTGQVKEDIISRFGELGIRILNGAISFDPLLLARKEFLKSAGVFQTFDLSGSAVSIPLAKGSLAFTFCQVPVVYHLSGERKIILKKENGEDEERPGLRLDRETSVSIFERRGEIRRLDVYLEPGR